MAFTDLLTSSRGPGFIGTIVALIVIIGFGLLFLLVFDEGLQGGGKTIEATIRDNQTEISDLGKMKVAREEKIKTAEGYQATIGLIEKQKAKNERELPRIAEAEARKQEAAAAVEQAKGLIVQYKDEYRVAAREAAKGMTIPELKVPSGTVYTNMKISKVDDIGIQFTHSNGGGRADFMDLSEEYRDKLGFDEDLYNKAKGKQDSHTEIYYRNNEKAEIEFQLGKLKTDSGDQQTKISSTLTKIEAIRKDTAGYALKIQNKKAEVAQEKNKKVSKAPQKTAELQALQEEWSNLKASVPDLERSIEVAKKKISDNKTRMAELNQKLTELNEKEKAEANASAAPQ